VDGRATTSRKYGDVPVGGGRWWRTSGVMTVQAASRDFSEQRQRRIFPGCRRRFGVDSPRTRSLEGRDGRVDPVCSPGPGPTLTRQTASRSLPHPSCCSTLTHIHTHARARARARPLSFSLPLPHTHTHTQPTLAPSYYNAMSFQCIHYLL